MKFKLYVSSAGCQCSTLSTISNPFWKKPYDKPPQPLNKSIVFLDIFLLFTLLLNYI
ncbi:Hypothetical protein MCYN_0140 [Mycoplasmopsis cynos C142]|uniref:Uncharacterized protein n=1 Tax=Mycoplasmopsis cynos (strain C142) TaxID=1246955 RepID=L0RV35_MYCC1|nr:Hypothetical protein MCYN_0140 [Mycoplasmopsis cynos C142]